MQKIVRALVLIPLAIAIIALAVANRQTVSVSLDPFDRSDPAVTVALPLFLLILLLIVTGVIVGGIAAWLRQHKWRSRARAAESQARVLRAENELLRRRDATVPPSVPPPVERAARLSIPPPAG